MDGVKLDSQKAEEFANNPYIKAWVAMTTLVGVPLATGFAGLMFYQMNQINIDLDFIRTANAKTETKIELIEKQVNRHEERIYR